MVRTAIRLTALLLLCSRILTAQTLGIRYGAMYTSDPTDWQYPTFKALSANAVVSFNRNGSQAPTPVLQYSTDSVTWNNYTIGREIELTAGQYVQFRCPQSATNSAFGKNASNYCYFKINKSKYNDAQVDATGNLAYIIWPEEDVFRGVTPVDYQFYGLFRGCSALVRSPDINIYFNSHNKSYIFARMFENCASLKTIPYVPADAGKYGYSRMFSGCTSLGDASNFTVQTETGFDMTGSYEYMFSGCTSLRRTPSMAYLNVTYPGICKGMFSGSGLVSVPDMTIGVEISYWRDINIHDIAASACEEMFKDCTQLVDAPRIYNPNLSQTNSLPRAGDSAFKNMFAGCTSLSSYPDLRFESYGNNTCEGMFQDSGISDAPKLYGELYGVSCFECMFKNCKNLYHYESLNHRILTQSCYYGMFYGSNLREAPLLQTESLANSCCASMFQFCTNLVYSPELPYLERAPYCFRAMFSYSAITSFSDLSGTTAEGCYSQMFEACRDIDGNFNINTFGDLHENCCYRMFYNSGVKRTVNMPMTYIADYNSCKEMYAFDDTFIQVHSTEITELFADVMYISDSAFYRMYAGRKVHADIALDINVSEIGMYSCFAMFSGSDITAPSISISAEYSAAYGLEYMFSGSMIHTSSIQLHVTITSVGYEMSRMFYNSEIQGAQEISITCEYAQPYAMIEMFSESSLPEATSVSVTSFIAYRNSMQNMFKNVTGRIKPSTTIMMYAYEEAMDGMFMNCTDITSAEVIVTDVLGQRACRQMFSGCIGLLSQTTSVDCGIDADFITDSDLEGAFSGMFSGCTSLTEPVFIPEGRAPSIAAAMYSGCTNIWSNYRSPILGSSYSSAYDSLFYGCSKLHEIHYKANSWPTNQQGQATGFMNWAYGVQPTNGTFWCSGGFASNTNNLIYGSSYIPENWDLYPYYN